MSRVTAQKKFLADQLGDVPEWFMRFLQRFNLFSEQVVDILNGKISVGDNTNQAFKVIEITAGATPDLNTASFLNPISGKPNGVIVVGVNSGYETVTSPVWLSWTFDGKSIAINSVTGLTSGNTYGLTLLVV